jgi:DNA uptake protein ComE-like DNA-binding protein
MVGLKVWKSSSPEVANRIGQEIIEKHERLTTMNSPKYHLTLAILLLAALAGCTKQEQSPQELKEKTAEATARAKSDAKAVAEGIREGWNRNKPLDLNAATRDQLMSLPGMTTGQADRVIEARPYNDPHDLVARHILPQAEYDRIADKVTVGK